MLTRNPQNVANLKERTRLRSATVWIPLDWGGVMQPLAGEAKVLASLGRPFVENYLAETDELFAVKESQRDQLSQLEQDKVAQEGRIADSEAVSKRRVLAFKLAGEHFVHAARMYDAQVRAFVMAAKEYAAEVEREQIKLARLQAIYSLQKAETRFQEINAEIFFERIKQMEVQVDIARTQIDVARAQVKAILSEIGAKEAVIEVIETELKGAMVAAEKASLQADIAFIYADIVARGLSTVRLGVETAEIKAGASWIQQKLQDLLKIWAARKHVEAVKTESTQQIVSEISQLVTAEIAGENLRTRELGVAQEVLAHEALVTSGVIVAEGGLYNAKSAARQSLESTRGAGEDSITDATTAAKKLTNAAQQALYKNKLVRSAEAKVVEFFVSKG